MVRECGKNDPTVQGKCCSVSVLHLAFTWCFQAGLVQRGESSPRSFLGRIFLFSTGKVPGEEAERAWTEGGPVIDK